MAGYYELGNVDAVCMCVFVWAYNQVSVGEG